MCNSSKKDHLWNLADLDQPSRTTSAISNAELKTELSPYMYGNFIAELQVINNVLKDFIMAAKLDNNAFIRTQYLKRKL